MQWTLHAGGLDALEEVYQLNRQVFDPCWSRASLLSALESGYDLLLCRMGDELAGYLLSLRVFDEVQIMQIAVAKPYRRLGLATGMTQVLIAGCERGAVTLEVRQSNHAARTLYRQLQFEECGYRKNYYAPDAAGQREDAVLMTRTIASMDDDEVRE